MLPSFGRVPKVALDRAGAAKGTDAAFKVSRAVVIRAIIRRFRTQTLRTQTLTSIGFDE